MEDYNKAIELFKSTYNIEPEVITKAPGRIEFIGNHTDYNLGTVIGSTINLGIYVVASRLTSDINNLKYGNIYFSSEFSQYKPVGFSPDEQIKQVEPSIKWVNYPLGIYKTLKQKHGDKIVSSFCLLAYATLPSGAGLSSSAAIDLSTELALIELSQPLIGIDYTKYNERLEIVKLGKESENNFVGISCGILDQGVCGFGNESSLVHIDCNLLNFTLIPFPKNIKFWIFNTHTKHSLVDSLYSKRHSECMGASKRLGYEYLYQADLELSYEDILHKVQDDTLAKRAYHIIGEIKRVKQVKEILEEQSEDKLNKVGKLLLQSHESSIKFFENSTKELDFIVDKLKENPNIYGCRLTGGGFGGAVMAMAKESFTKEEALLIVKSYKNEFNDEMDVIETNPGKGMEVLKKLANE